MRNIVLMSLLLVPFQVNAEIFRQASACNESGQMCFYWWPKLKDVSGWSQDVQHSFHYKANTQVPSGYTFSDAEAIIYAKAVYKPQRSGIENIDQFIEQEKSDFLARNPKFSVSELEELRDFAGRKYVSYKFIPGGSGNWEQAAYSEETDKDGNEYFLVFVLSSRSESGYNHSVKAFKQFITSYE